MKETKLILISFLIILILSIIAFSATLSTVDAYTLKFSVGVNQEQRQQYKQEVDLLNETVNLDDIGVRYIRFQPINKYKFFIARYNDGTQDKIKGEYVEGLAYRYSNVIIININIDNNSISRVLKHEIGHIYAYNFLNDINEGIANNIEQNFNILNWTEMLGAVK